MLPCAIAMPLGLPVGAGGVDHIGGMRGPGADAALRPGVRRQGGAQCRRVEHRHGARPAGQAMALRLGRHQRHRLRILDAHRDPLRRRLRVQRQPGRAGLGDGQLHHQQFQAAWQPQADDAARHHAVLDDQAVRRRVGPGVEFGIAQRTVLEDQRHVVRNSCGGRLEQIGQRLVAEQVGIARSLQDGEGAVEGEGIVHEVACGGAGGRAYLSGPPGPVRAGPGPRRIRRGGRPVQPKVDAEVVSLKRESRKLIARGPTSSMAQSVSALADIGLANR